MTLEAYRVPDAVKGGVDITLPHAPGDVFRVRLPSKHNRAFARAVQAAMFEGVSLSPTGRVEMGKIDVAGLRDARLDAFLAHCIVWPVPGGLTPDQLREDYFPALEALFEEAEARAEALDREGDDAGKKSRRSSSGKSDG